MQCNGCNNYIRECQVQSAALLLTQNDKTFVRLSCKRALAKNAFSKKMRRTDHDDKRECQECSEKTRQDVTYRCLACGQAKAKDAFSRKMREKNQNEKRRCLVCVEGGVAIDAGEM